MSVRPVVASPCTNVCQIDPGTGWCLGCGRAIDEIARWGSTDAGDRDAVWAQLAERMARLKG